MACETRTDDSRGYATGKHRLRNTLAVAMAAALPLGAQALELDYEVGVAARYQDNIALTASDRDPIEDTILSPRVYFDATHEGPRAKLVAHGALQYLDYLDNTFDDETRARFNGQLDLAILPERLDFVFKDYLSQQPIDQLDAYSPNNNQTVNVFVTGPTLKARFGSTTRGELDLRYANNHAEETETFNGDRYSAAARVIHDLSASRSVSVNLESVDAQFDQQPQRRDYRRYNGYGNYSARNTRLDASFDLGYSKVELDGSGRDESTPLVRATLEWKPTPYSLWGITARQQFTDSGEDMTRMVDLDDFRFNEFNVPYLVEPSAFEERTIRGRYRFSGERLTLQVLPYYRRVRYVDSTLEDENRRGVILTGEYKLRPRLTASFYALKERREFVDIGREDDDLVYSVGLANRFTRHWTGRIDYLRQERDSNVARRSFDSNSVSISISYRR